MLTQIIGVPGQQSGQQPTLPVVPHMLSLSPSAYLTQLQELEAGFKKFKEISPEVAALLASFRAVVGEVNQMMSDLREAKKEAMEMASLIQELKALK